MSGNLYDKIQKRFGIKTKSQAKNYVFALLYGSEESYNEIMAMIKEEEEEHEIGGESG